MEEKINKETKYWLYFGVAIVLGLICFWALSTDFHEQFTAYEAKVIADNYVYNYGDNVSLTRITSVNFVSPTGTSSSWKYQYQVWLSNDTSQYFRITTLGNGIDEVFTYYGNATNLSQPINLTMDSDIAMEIALTDGEFKDYLEYIDYKNIEMETNSFGPTSRGYEEWYIEAWIPLDDNGRITVDTTTGMITYKEITAPGDLSKNFYSLGLLLFLVLLATGIFKVTVINRVRKKEMEQEEYDSHEE